MKRILPSLALILALLASSAATQGTPSALADPKADPPVQSRYTITDLGNFQPYGINKKGQVVGTSWLTNHAVVWDDGTTTDLGTLGGQKSFAADINDAGQIAGWAEINNGKSRAFLWQDGVMQNLGTIGGNASGAFGINTAGQVVGWDDFHDEAWSRAFLWENGAMQILGTNGYHDSAQNINDAAQVVGQCGVGPPSTWTTHACLWQNGTIQDLGSLEGDISRASAINNAGQVVGESDLIGARHAILWQNGEMQDLGTLGGNFSEAYDINDAGQVVGSSTMADWQRHAFIWENGQMKDLNTLIPADSGWVLRYAYGINKGGQIVGNGSINGQAHGFLLTPRPPVLIVPGIAGTYSDIAIFDSFWLMNRGVHPDNLQIDPLAHVYDDLIQTLKNVGYQEGKDLFVVNYDWRLPPGPSDGNFDGHISGLNAPTLVDEQFNYAVDYLGYYLRQAAEAYRTQYAGVLPAVNIIAHSTGGLVARAYIQSDAYGGEYDAVNHYDLPEVDQFIMVGVPNRGASKAWNPLHDNWIADIAYRVVLSKIVNRAYQKVLQGGVILGPDYPITLASISPDGQADPKLFIEKYVPTIRSLLATYDFIDFGNGFVNLNDDPAQRNNLVLDLNNGLDLSPPVDPNPFADDTTTTVICAAEMHTANLVVERTGTAREDVLLPFTDFFANDADASDEWYEDLWMANGGDGTVPLESCYEQFVGDARVTSHEFFGANLDHTGMVSNVNVQSLMLDTLQVEYQTQDISTGAWQNLANVISVISDPAETILVDGAGRRLGYSQATGVLTEISGSIWFGEADGFGFVTGSIVEPLHLELTGLGEDYYVMVAVDRNGRPVGGAVSSGYLAEGEVLTIPVVIQHALFLPVVIR